jgi:hypothetical protein
MDNCPTRTSERLRLLLLAETPQEVGRLHALLASIPPDEAAMLLEEVIRDNPPDPKARQSDKAREGAGIALLILLPWLLPVVLLFLYTLLSLWPFVVPISIYFLIVAGPRQVRRRRQRVGLRALRLLAAMDDERAIGHLTAVWRVANQGKLPPDAPMDRTAIEAELIRLRDRHLVNPGNAGMPPVRRATVRVLHRFLDEALPEIRRQTVSSGDIREESADLILTALRFLARHSFDSLSLIQRFAALTANDSNGNTAIVRDGAAALTKAWHTMTVSDEQPVGYYFP